MQLWELAISYVHDTKKSAKQPLQVFHQQMDCLRLQCQFCQDPVPPISTSLLPGIFEGHSLLTCNCYALMKHTVSAVQAWYTAGAH